LFKEITLMEDDKQIPAAQPMICPFAEKVEDGYRCNYNKLVRSHCSKSILKNNTDYCTLTFPTIEDKPGGLEDKTN